MRSSAARRCSICSRGTRGRATRSLASVKPAPPQITIARRSMARARRSSRCRCVTQRMTKYGLRTGVSRDHSGPSLPDRARTGKRRGLPKFRDRRACLAAFPRCPKGWALYAEKAGYAENGYNYKRRPGEITLGMLDAQLFRARRLIVVAWLARQEMDASAGHRLRHGSQRSGTLRRESGRAMRVPDDQGQLQILELRDRARTALGDKFSPQHFHASYCARAACRWNCSVVRRRPLQSAEAPLRTRESENRTGVVVGAESSAAGQLTTVS